MKTVYYKVVPTGVDEEKKTLYFVMVPTHENPRPGRERQAFSPAYDEAAKRMVAKTSGGYTFVPPCEGGWVNPGGSLQDEPMRPFLFTAKSREEADSHRGRALRPLQANERDGRYLGKGNANPLSPGNPFGPQRQKT